MPIRKLATNTIKISRVKDDLLTLLTNRQDQISSGTAEIKWNVFKVSKEKLGTAVRKHKINRG